MIQSVGVGVRILALCSGEKTNESARNSIVLSFGRHKGKRLSSVSNSYLSWMVANLPGDPWADLAQQHLSDRRSPLSSHWRWIESSLASAQSLEEARAIQARIFASLPGAAEDAQVGNLLVQAMARLGGTKEARVAFARIKIKDAASWSSMIEGYSRNGQHRKAIDLYRRLLFQAEIEPNAAIFAAALEASS
ncbi:pentatricopeptide repeat-containing protein At1g28690, mitochondrial-like [Selaginella moellendorffii]|uniref:pentatricopeptide repeat-containing protein At1g28690, mitochondrial-like n=1 Tax=Selaginella moellendorffii TaxID=88036 RepID=UPI000D1C480B|nr:pentatricopeptide repeat-containing protein At1g28690, mitochondrial-like [Selaginella moellendorffii]|eukprot:XP_024537793.1 pentatricopeptide repeat-containing protein At1g28690, mitochondrial-like [Selaginella moellendorffii]